MENLLVPMNFVVEFLFKTSAKLPFKEISRNLFSAICQSKGVDLIYSERIEGQMRYQISKLRSKMKKLRGKHNKERLLKRYKTEVWPFKVLHSEYKLSVMRDERVELIVKNSKLKKALSQSNSRCAKLKRRYRKMKMKYKSYKSKLNEAVILRKKVAVEIVRKARKMKDRRPFSSYSRAWQHKLRASAKDKCKLALSYLGLVNCEAHNVVVKNNTTKRFEKLTLIDNSSANAQNGKCPPSMPSKSLSPEKLEIIRLLMLIKDEHNISDRAYSAIASISDLPTLYALKQEMDKASSYIEYSKTPGKEPGVERNIESIIKRKIEYLADEGLVGSENSKIRVKVSGDGTIVGKANHFVNITCTILNDVETATSETGHEPVAIINAEEKYDILKAHLSNVVHSVETFHKFSYKDVAYSIEYFLGGDYKFLLQVLGLQAANSTYSCIYCKKPKQNYSDANMTAELRTIAEIIECSNKPEKSKSKFCCAREPIFPSIPLNRVIIDTLHLFLRISDKLTDELIRDLEIADHMTTKKAFDRAKASHMVAFENMLVECGIHGVKFFVKEGGRAKPRDLTGPEKLKLFANLDKVENLLRTCNHRPGAEVAKIMSVWREFIALYDLMRSRPSLGSLQGNFGDRVQHLCKQWLKMYSSVFTTHHVTPYMHILADHISDIIRLHGSINIFNSQGLEKRNHTLTIDYFKSTNHQRGNDGITSISQLMRKCNRKMFLLKKQIALQKRDRTCSLCLKKGHDKRLCRSTRK